MFHLDIVDILAIPNLNFRDQNLSNEKNEYSAKIIVKVRKQITL